MNKALEDLQAGREPIGSPSHCIPPLRAPARPPGSIEVPINHALAYIIGIPTLLLAPMVYWQFDSALFGVSGLTNLFLITGAGGMVSFALFGGRRRWLIGAVLGLIGGLGAAGAHVLYTSIFHRETMYDKESALVCWAGAGPAMGALLYILTRDKKAFALSAPESRPL